MNILNRILAFLNIIAAIVLLYFLAQVYVARTSWQRALRNLEERLAGISTQDLLQLVRESPDYQKQVEDLEKNPPQSEEALRLALLNIIFPPDKLELLADAAQVEQFRQRYGLSYDDVRAVTEDRVSLLRNRLREEEQELRNLRRLYETLEARLKEATKRAEEASKTLVQQLDIETQQHVKIEAQILREYATIAFLQARLAEVFASLQVAEGRLEDMQTELAYLSKRWDELSNECQQLQKRIRDLEKLAELRRPAP